MGKVHCKNCGNDSFNLYPVLSDAGAVIIHVVLCGKCNKLRMGVADNSEVPDLQLYKTEWNGPTYTNYGITQKIETSEAQKSLDEKRRVFYEIWEGVDGHELEEATHMYLIAELMKSGLFKASKEADAIIKDAQRNGMIYERREGVYTKTS